MDHTRDADAYMVPLTPASVGSGSYLGGPDIGSVVASDVTGVTPSSGGSSGKSLVQNPLYRIAYLADNKIFLRDREEYPKHIGSLVGEMGKDRDSPGPSPDDVWQDLSLRKLELGAAESTVERYFCTNLLPNPGPTESLMCSYRQPMHRHAVPNTGSNFKISTPVPDMAYGYNRETAFTGAHQTLLLTESSVAANVHDLLYPFLVIEFKGDSPSGSGSLWVATNQCMGGSVSCVNVAERFNHRLGHYQSDEVQPSNTAAFSIAMSGTEARIFVSWKHDEGKYYVQKVDSFLLQSPEGYLKFRKFVLNIIDWGRGRRLNEIRKSLDTLMEESRKGPPKLAKARPSPLAGSETRPSKKLKLSA
ncbi:hypothetical protein A1O3_08412 [Capronia epimyces CBS 606.96]|uniref:DUF7924 domain-containing protein n=1 Tax=Capronia epimyces CBS 606.96 TaxID=1182542 RepID=W9XEK4_9EURO|nr:uncharacterized protein A1O3_08412 [Capronia epimyces CBS 606.96]EXJ78912.1 hypothetical protein A1O3_08412 [Capronia epimyces CBS 606.96]